MEKCQDFVVGFLVKKELILWQGQANDALHQLCIDLEHHSYLYRTQVKHAGHGQQKKTRAWDNVHSIEDAVKLHAAIYRKCRSAMISLGAGPDLVKTYKELKLEDLTSQTALIDPSLPGQRNKTLPWFWTIDVPEDAKANDWMSECKFSSVLNDKLMILIVMLKFSGFNGCVPRCFKEEVKLLEAEMGWTVNCFHNQSLNWKGLWNVADNDRGRA